MKQLSVQDLKDRIKVLEKKAGLKDDADKLARALFDISYAVNTTDDLHELYQSIYDALNRLMKLPNFYISIYDAEKNTIHFPFHLDEKDNSDFKSRLFLDGNSLTSEVILSRKPLFLNEVALKKRDDENRVVGPLPKVWIGVPLMISKKVIGVVAIQSYTDADYFSRQDVDILVLASNHIALAIERKQSLYERDRAENFLYNIINSMPSILIGIDPNLCVTHWNLQAELETGCKSEAAVGKKFTQVFPRLSHIIEPVEQSIRTNRLKTLLKQPFKDGSTTQYEDIIIYPISSDKVDGAVIRIDNISEQVQLEEMMIQSEKMMSVGGLAAGMAHEINNPLAGMMQNAQVIYNRLTADIPANIEAAAEAGVSMTEIKAYTEKRQILDKLELINSTGSRAARIVKNMLSFARKSNTVMESTDICDLLLKTVDLAKSDYNLKKKYDFKQIKIQTDFDPELPKVFCDKSKIQQVFLNILKNGAHALFKNKNELSPCLTLKTWAKDNRVHIEINDNGPGVDNIIQKRLFEPFFTTKPVGEGTGLGLSVSYFIIANEHKGDMRIESSPGKGTTFIITLPVSAGS